MRDDKKISIVHYGAYAKVLNRINKDEYKYINSYTNVHFMENIFSDYYKMENMWHTMFDSENRKITIFDKIYCLLLALRNNRTFFITGNDEKIRKKFSDLNEKLMVEASLIYMEASTYKVRKSKETIIDDTQFTLDGFNKNHKRELNNLKKLLLEELKKDNLDYNAIYSLLVKIYVRAVIYNENIDIELEDMILKNLHIKVSSKAPNITETLNKDFIFAKRNK